ncbi:MAG: hypothetical protein JXQ71_16055, partial [Verrucomicrobia bacterium]|nr:hypothetical protein [Verrucomicrobiota bacterium]
ARFGAGLAGAFEIHKSWPFILMAGPVPVPTYAKVGLEVEAEAQLQVMTLEPIGLNGSLALDPYVRGSLGVGVDEVLAIEGWIGGGLDLDLQCRLELSPEPEFDVSLYLNGGATVYFLLWTWENEFLYWEWPEDKALRSRLFSPLAAFSTQPKLLSRDYLNQTGSARFFSSPAKVTPAGLATTPASLVPQSSPLQTSVFPYSEPDCASAGTNFHLVWLSDDPARSAMNRTRLEFSHFNGTEWSEPVPVADDGTADFHPQILTFSDGSAVCAWENQRAALPDTATLDDMKAGLEIAVAWYDATANEWGSTQSQMNRSTNSWLDRSPKLAGRSRDNVLLVWTANPSNHITGTATEPNELLASTWNGTTWSTPEVFITLTFPLVKYDLAYDGTNGHVVMTLDTSNTHTNVGARELFYMAYQDGAWSALERLTDDQVPDDNPLLALDQDGRCVLVWLKDTEISSAVDFQVIHRQIVRTNLYSSNLGDAKLARSSDGKLALVWAEPADFSSDLHAVFYDPVFRLWGQPKQLTSDAETERNLTTAFRGTDQLVAVYNRRLIGPTNSGTGADLYVLQYGLGEDLALNLFYSSPPNPGPGDMATFQATVGNLGDKAAANVPVAFYLGDPGAGGVEVGRIGLTQSLAPGETADITFGWTLPTTNLPLTLYALVDPGQALADVVRNNNSLGLKLAKADLAVTSVTWSQIASNTLSVAACVGNQGVVTGQTATVEFRLGSPDGTNLFSQSLTNLAPGEATEIAFLWDMSDWVGAPDIYVVLTGPDPGTDFDLANNNVRLSLQLAAAPSTLALGPLVRLPGGLFQLTVLGEAGRYYQVETSTNLSDWEPWIEFFSTNMSTPVIDSTGTNTPQRYYRAVGE